MKILSECVEDYLTWTVFILGFIAACVALNWTSLFLESRRLAGALALICMFSMSIISDIDIPKLIESELTCHISLFLNQYFI